MNKKNIKGISALAMSFFIFPLVALAQAKDPYGIKATAESAGMGGAETNLTKIIGNMVGGILSLVGVIFLILMIYGGVSWMTAGGNDQKVEKAKGLITNSIIGLVIIFAAYAITYFVVEVLMEAV